jgi:hypothetical protein
VFGPYFDRIAARATGDEHAVEVRKARREFQDLTGKLEEDQPWFEQRMSLFLEWYVLDRLGPSGLTPAERFLAEEKPHLDEHESEIFEGMTATQRSLFRIDGWDAGRIDLTDMIGGGSWSVHQEQPMIGLMKGDLIDARIVPFRDELFLGRGMVFHPRAAVDQIVELLEAAHAAGKLSFDLVNLLASLRLRFEQYRHVKVRHIYRLSSSWGGRSEGT